MSERLTDGVQPSPFWEFRHRFEEYEDFTAYVHPVPEGSLEIETRWELTFVSGAEPYAYLFELKQDGNGAVVKDSERTVRLTVEQGREVLAKGKAEARKYLEACHV